MERNLPGEDVQDLPGDTAPGVSVINQEERYRLEPPNGARPKWTRSGRALPVIEEPSSPGAGATVDADDFERNGGEMGVPSPVLPPLRQDQQGAGVTTPTQIDADRRGGLRGPEGWMPGKGASAASHIGAEAWDKDVNSDRQHFPLSPENVLVDTVAQLQQDLNDMRAESRYLRTPGVRNTLQRPRQMTYIYVDKGTKVRGNN